MTHKPNLLIVSDNSDVKNTLEGILQDFSVICVESGMASIQVAKETAIDLVLLSISLPDMDGYSVSKKIIETVDNPNIPILYLANSNLNDEIRKDIQYCDVKYLTEPYASNLLLEQIGLSLAESQDEHKHQQELNQVTDALLSLQNDNARLHDICVYLRKSYFVTEVKEHCQQLLDVTSTYGIHACVYVHSDKNRFFLDSDSRMASPLNHDILELASGGRRIMQFGRDRAIFNWETASLLVDKLGSDVDILAMLMDGFEAGLKAIEGIDEFHKALDTFRKQNNQLSLNVRNVVQHLTDSLNNELSRSGAVNMLTVEQEDALIKITDDHLEQVDQLFDSSVRLDQTLETIVTEMRSNGPDNDMSDNDDDQIDFF